MRVEDYFPTGKRWWFRLHEKGGKRHEVPAHHNAEEYLDAYLEAAAIGKDKKGPLFRTVGRNRELTGTRMHRLDVLRMIYRRAKAAGLDVHACCHTFRATGITAYLEAGGTIEKAQQIAAHESGSNMSRDRKEERTGAIRDARRCRLLGYRFAFNKRSGRVPGAAFANIVSDDTSTVWSVAYLCNKDAFERLDHFEGVLSGHYKHLSVSVVLDNGDVLDAITYVAGESYICEERAPTDVYLNAILVGAREHQLPAEYIERIETLGRPTIA
jgi:hypothetical protein